MFRWKKIYRVGGSFWPTLHVACRARDRDLAARKRRQFARENSLERWGPFVRMLTRDQGGKGEKIEKVGRKEGKREWEKGDRKRSCK